MDIAKKDEINAHPKSYYEHSKYGMDIIYNDRFKVTPYSEFLIESISKTDFNGKRVCDFGCGTGVVGLGVAASSDCTVIGIDIEEEALLLSNENSVLNNINNTFFFKEDSYLSSIQDLIPAEKYKFDFILSNPASLPVPENLAHGSFSNGGVDGSKMIAELVSFADRNLKEDGKLLFLHTSLTSLSQTISFLDHRNFGVTIERVMQLEFRDNYDHLVEHIAKLKASGKAFYFENQSNKYELVYLVRAEKIQFK